MTSPPRHENDAGDQPANQTLTLSSIDVIDQTPLRSVRVFAAGAPDCSRIGRPECESADPEELDRSAASLATPARAHGAPWQALRAGCVDCSGAETAAESPDSSSCLDDPRYSHLPAVLCAPPGFRTQNLRIKSRAQTVAGCRQVSPQVARAGVAVAGCRPVSPAVAGFHGLIYGLLCQRATRRI